LPLGISDRNNTSVVCIFEGGAHYIGASPDAITNRTVLMQCLPRQQSHQISRSGLVRLKWGFHHVTSSMTSALVPVVGSVGSQTSGDRLAEYKVAWKNSDIPSSANFRTGKSTDRRKRQKCQNHSRNETEPSAKYRFHEILFGIMRFGVWNSQLCC